MISLPQAEQPGNEVLRMKIKFSISFKHPPPTIEVVNPSLCLLFGTSWFAEFRDKYGYFILLLQELEQNLRTSIIYIKMAYGLRGFTDLINTDPDSATFDLLINTLETQLDGTEGDRDFIRHLNEIRRYRNQLAHKFLRDEPLEELLSGGGRNRLIEQLNKKIELVITLISVVENIGRSFASECGMTSEHIEILNAERLDRLGLSEEDYREYILGAKLPETEGSPKPLRLEDL